MARCERGLMPATYRVKTYLTWDWSAAACSKAAVKSPVSSLDGIVVLRRLVFGHIGSFVDDLGEIRLMETQRREDSFGIGQVADDPADGGRKPSAPRWGWRRSGR